MLLAIDTATRLASIALYDGDGVHGEATWRARENHTVELLAQIARLVGLARVAKGNVRAIAVALGPGSFTGLRVGLSVAKGLAFGGQVALLGIPTLDALALAHSFQPLPIWALIAAGRGRYSVACYSAKRGAIRRSGDYALVNAQGLADLAERAMDGAERRRPARALFCGEMDATLSQTLADRLGSRAVIALPAMNVRRASFLAELAWARFARGEADDTASLAPMYTPHV
ncbi:MAG: tRNA (adenosine(37)-N6)-threonylcarbamoyltransferase complex dimerization subunit type 1 TsaB [Chloroflexi bacterium]|nr:tRNA (adenosine(37)-N6)-threonylcarbamoyltransferase complex dimerization subunit type 1 TsaB [Chloroflexota bacterium]